ncbi:MAG: hypothetical protein PHI37_03525 [Candidatus Gracilibacteria bacterium]|nr:hypothetical protein [Candidatus Gracilibacteria bacterium]
MNEKINSGILKEKEKIDKKMMLDNLANEISKKFKIEKTKALSLIKSETLDGLDNLKKELKVENLNNKQLEELFLVLKGAQEIIANASKIEIKILKEDIEKNVKIEDFVNIVEKHLPPKLLQRAKNPKNIHEHILGFSLGTSNSIISIIDALYQIGAGIIKMPYHIYMIVSGKGEIKSMKKI